MIKIFKIFIIILVLLSNNNYAKKLTPLPPIEEEENPAALGDDLIEILESRTNRELVSGMGEHAESFYITRHNTQVLNTINSDESIVTEGEIAMFKEFSNNPAIFDTRVANFNIAKALKFQRALSKLPRLAGLNVRKIYTSVIANGLEDLRDGDYVVAEGLPTLFFENPNAPALMLKDAIRTSVDTPKTIVNYIIENPTEARSAGAAAKFPGAGISYHKYGASFKVQSVSVHTLEKGSQAGTKINIVELVETESVPEDANIYNIVGSKTNHLAKIPVERLSRDHIDPRLRVKVQKQCDCI